MNRTLVIIPLVPPPDPVVFPNPLPVRRVGSSSSDCGAVIFVGEVPPHSGKSISLMPFHTLKSALAALGFELGSANQKAPTATPARPPGIPAPEPVKLETPTTRLGRFLNFLRRPKK